MSIDYSWAKATGGALSARQRRQLLSPLLRVIVGDPARRARMGARASWRRRARSRRPALAGLPPREGRRAGGADVLSPHVLEHSYRTYLFGLTLAAIDGKGVDEELGYVSSCCTTCIWSTPTPGRCFAVVGRARGALRAGPWRRPGARRTIGAAIAGHIHPGASDDMSDPAGFVSGGAFVDVAGVRLEQMDPAFVARLLERHPRLEFKRHLLKAWADERKGCQRAARKWLTRYAAFPLLVRMAPFEE